MPPRPMLRAELPYHDETSALFAPLADDAWAMLLDSGRPHATAGRYDVVVAEPRAVVLTYGARTEVRDDTGVRTSTDDPFALLQAELERFDAAASGELPFCGGALGYFGYDLGRRLERLPELAADHQGLPELAVGIYDWAFVVDHLERRSWIVAHDLDAASRRRFARYRALLRQPREDHARAPLTLSQPLRSSLDREAYGRAFERVQEHLQAGDCYQVNLAQRWAAKVEGDPWAGYLQLRRLHPVAYGAYLNTPAAQILCSSPERFLRVRSGDVETRPIKGTRPRGRDAESDAALRADLLRSAKDRAENLMIVDLLRNDLGKSCVPGSIEVPELFAIESTSAVSHLVSTVRGRLLPHKTSLELLRGCFPGGSITGAPKLRAMQIIETLEPERRGVYCGAIGYVGFDGAMDTNIVIRTLVHGAGTIRLWAGGGIVADSEVESEYQESLAKAAAMMGVFR